MEKVNLTIDNMKVEVHKGITVLEAARASGIEIPTLCFLKDINEVSSCRICLVEIGQKLLPSCTVAVEEGMIIRTNTLKVREARKTILQLLLSNHKRECTTCLRNGKCELEKLSQDLALTDIEYEGEKNHCDMDTTGASLIRNAEKCILCERCISVCKNIQTVGAINFSGRGFTTKVAPAYDRALADTVCVNCGQCVTSCPTGALTEKENIEDIWRELDNPDKYVVVQTAPAIRVALGEEFGLSIGTRVTGKMTAALRRMGFNRVFDTDFAADLTIIEEGTELIKRLESGENLPLMTSCCPGWVKFVEHNFHDMLNNLSTCKSPHEMEGAIIKSYFAEKEGIDPSKIVVVSIMPCIAKKFEEQRDELSRNGMKDVDYVLSTRELAKMIRQSSIDFVNLKDDDFDSPIGMGSGAATIFGVTGGVTEAALRTVFETTSGEKLDNIEFKEVRGIKGIKEAKIILPNGNVIDTVIISGLGNAREVVEQVRKGEKHYDFIEVMACPGGCVTGGGQPIISSKIREEINIKEERAKAIYEEERSLIVRKSHENPYVNELYKEFLGQPNGHKAHELLHTHYVERNMF
ncbi:NADH-quinone oxidoreductase subunit G/NADP-reducing hydrogenase subunit HndD [Clostridium pascui]|uniref:NADH-dependent [FeFe] hydrogenase, group A6 n=1 Tax=Clostridium pascui TaxID=46609 RepID=UPI001957EFC8|nr:NADH-dependent [FeFe] hydrogenase, group A6 [Clostridium pascui]MBM7870985.1 NADH-quinone oxidoreductase subunit G/NADP-reducing hydrogenase subunit HndD [Clostridium pascui]